MLSKAGLQNPSITAQRVTLTGHVHPKATPANDRGRVAPSLKLSYVTLTLTQSDAQKADLKHLLAEQQNPASPNYHRWLTPGQYADRFGVSAEDIGTITQWLQGQGLSIINVAQGRNWIAVSGSAAQIEAAFATEIHQYAVDGETHFANATNPSVPAAIGGMVLSIRGLNDFRMRPRIQKPKYTSAQRESLPRVLTIWPQSTTSLLLMLPGSTEQDRRSSSRDNRMSPSPILQQFQSFFNLTPNLPQMVLVGHGPRDQQRRSGGVGSGSGVVGGRGSEMPRSFSSIQRT